VTPIQILLLAGLGSGAALTAARWKRGDLRTASACGWGALWASGMVLVAVPEWANTAARAVGVGRGADLVTYVLLVFLLGGVFRLMVVVDRQRREFTALVRELALKDVPPREASPPTHAEESRPHA